MNWTPATMTENDEDEQQLECNRRDDEEVYRDQVLGMVLEKGPPSLRGRIAVPYQVYGDGRLRNFDSDLQQFSVNTRSTPAGVGQAPLPNRFRNSGYTVGRPSRRRLFHFQQSRNPWRCQAMTFSV